MLPLEKSSGIYFVKVETWSDGRKLWKVLHYSVAILKAKGTAKIYAAILWGGYRADLTAVLPAVVKVSCIQK